MFYSTLIDRDTEEEKGYVRTTHTALDKVQYSGFGAVVGLSRWPLWGILVPKWAPAAARTRGVLGFRGEEGLGTLESITVGAVVWAAGLLGSKFPVP